MSRRTLVAALVAVIGLTTVASAFAARPTFQNRETFTETDTNFCGTGKTVLVEGRVVENVWLEGDQVKATLSLHITFTNPETGASAVERWSRLFTDTIVSGDPAGVHTHEFTHRGLKATLKLANGRVLTRDAGSVTFRVTVNDMTGEVLGFELVSMRGPHPGFEEDLFCSTLVPALGLG